MTLNPMRDPALIVLTLLAPTVQTGLLVWGGLSPQAQALWNAATVAVAGLVTAALVARERLAPAISGFAVAVLALATFYGWHLSAEASTAVISLVTLFTGAFIRTQVDAKVDPDGTPRPIAA